MLRIETGRRVVCVMALCFAVQISPPPAYGQKPPAPAAAARQAIEATRASNANSLVGRVRYVGSPPPPKKIDFSRANQRDNVGRTWGVYDADHYSQLGLIDESLVVGEDGGIANVFVWLTSKDVPPPPDNGPAPPSTIRMKGGRFEPRGLAFWNEVPMNWEFSDATQVTHVEWDPVANLPHSEVLRSGTYRRFLVKKPEPHPIRLSSKFHPWLQSYVLPLAHPYHAVTGPDGRFEIKNLPIGEWEFAIWHERAGWLKSDKFPSGRFKSFIALGENNLGDLRVEPAAFVPSSQPQPQPRRDGALDEVDRDAENLRQLAREVRALLPPGWRADFNFDFGYNTWMPRRTNEPSLIIYYEQETLGYHRGPGMPGSTGGGYPSKPLRLWISLTLNSYLAPEQYRAILGQNLDKERRRLEFERRLVGIAFSGKVSDPKPPYAFEPKNAEQSELLRQYALFWMRTELDPLPTHHYRTLAMTIQFPLVHLEDKNVQQQLEQTESRLLRLVTSYEEQSSSQAAVSK